MYFTTQKRVQKNERRRMNLIKKIQSFGPSIIVLLMVVLAIFIAIHSQKKIITNALERESEVLLNALNNELIVSEGYLSSLKRFFVSSNFIDRHEFESFTGPVLEASPDILALEWVPEVTQQQRQRFTDLVHQDGLKSFSFKRWQPSLGWTAQSKSWAQRYYPVYYVEPLESNQSLFGADLGSHKQRRKAIDLALESRTAVASDVIELAQGGKGVLILLSIQSEDSRRINRQQEKGLVLAAINIEAYFKTVNERQGRRLIQYTVRENNHFGRILYDTKNPSADSSVTYQAEFSFLNQSWYLNINAGPDFHEAYSNNSVLYTLIAGLVFILLVLKYNLSIISETRRIESKVASGMREIHLKEASLDYTRSRQKVIVDLMIDAVITIDHKGIVDEFNPAAEVMFGYSKSEVSGRNIKCLMPESFSQAHDTYLSNYKQTGIRHVIDIPTNVFGLHKGGSIFPVNLMVSEHKTDSTSMFIGILHDLTDEQDRQAEQQAMTRQLESILDSAREGVCGISSDGFIRFANRSAEKMLGYDMNALDGFNFGRLIYSDSSASTDLDGVVSTLKQALLDGRDTTEGTEFVVTAEGNILPISFSLCLMKSESDEASGFVLVFKDNTDSLAAAKLIQQQHQALVTANVDLNRANKDMEQFAYVASHDLKAPLRAISNLACWVCEDLGDTLTGESLENMTLLRNRVSRLDTLLTDLLAYSRAGRGSNETQDINSGAVIKDLVDLQGVPDHVEVVLEDDLPVVHTNRVAFDLIIRNLLSNAVKHAGPTAARIEIAAQVHDSEITFSVTDDGPGILLEDHERIFELFTKLNTSEDVEGSGMGLSICRRAVDQIGGRIWIDSEITSGARFMFSIPNSAE